MHERRRNRLLLDRGRAREAELADPAQQQRVEGPGDPREFTLTIPNVAFTARQARFQDAPDLCFARLQRELATNAELADGAHLVITPAELDEYRDAQLRRSPDRKVRTLRTWP